MFCTPEYTQNVSLRLSNVLDEIGVNDNIVMKRRNTVLTEESLRTVTKTLEGLDTTLFHFGSRTEGTTTAGLLPDSDTLVCDNHFNIMQDLGEWQQGFTNLLMVRDEDTPPGYCLLQKTYENVPLPVDYTPSNDFVTDRRRRVVMKNSWFVDRIPEGCTRHGPSQSLRGIPGFADDDLVYAYYCKSWPLEAMPWLQRGSVGNWPTEEIKRQSVNDGCFVVPVGKVGTQDEELQWRISTCLTERTLMFSLNISQIRCYVLMKMILKSYPILHSDDALSTFICKTVLIHCIESTQANFWQDDNLLSSLNFCLKFLYNCVSFDHCPHFIIHVNNLMAGRIPPDIKPQILEGIRHIILSNGRALLEIEIDQLGRRLSGQLGRRLSRQFQLVLPSVQFYCQNLSGNLLHNFMLRLSACNREFLSDLAQCKTEIVVQTLSQSIDKLGGIHLEGNEFEQAASKLLSPFLCMSLGSVLASHSISLNRFIPREAFALLLQGSKADLSSRLKCASVFYCTGNMVQTEYILKDIEEQYNLVNVQSVCCCYQEQGQSPGKSFITVSAVGDIEAVINYTGFCVRYLPYEFNCIPEELQHELFRSEFDMHQNRGMHDDWMDWVAVDSIPYFYFLQYKVYSSLGDIEQQQRAFTNLRRRTDTDLSLGHRETALNLLGQCMEEEDRLEDALNCYTESTNLHPTNNAANFHTSQVLQKIHDRQ
ncbi:uncharacterized protein LOC123556227 [Mercenaria mercenaria]|uniref:uncharacterized protein LOC123556227 n=1 Tax=Mercenaria mercenaria TaxID=6596 RepID=UPI00234F107E|nr:uncharacterized protein LOC123556227 [Mercenaria mercenaria]